MTKSIEELPREELPRRVTLADVAAVAGVSASLASRVLNGYDGLRPRTRERVVQAATDLGYRPHALARALRKSQTGVLALLIPSLRSGGYSLIVHGAVEYARSRETVVILQEDVNEAETTAAVSLLVQDGRIDGLLVASAQPSHPLLAYLAQNALPHVFLNRAVRGSHRNVIMKDALASEMALQHLYDLGHRHVGHVSGPLSLEPAQRRAKGFVDAAKNLRLPQPPMRAGEFSEAGGASAARVLLTDHPDLTALYTSSLSQALGVLHVAREFKRRVPEDLSVVTYDDMPIANYLQPTLTSISMPLEELGAAAVVALLAQLAGEEPTNTVVEGLPTLIPRGSTTRPRPTRGRSS